MDEWKEPNYLVHHGIKGQRWGVRRFQNSDGSLTSAGRSRYGSATPQKINVSQYDRLSQRVSSKGQSHGGSRSGGSGSFLNPTLTLDGSTATSAPSTSAVFVGDEIAPNPKDLSDEELNELYKRYQKKLNSAVNKRDAANKFYEFMHNIAGSLSTDRIEMRGIGKKIEEATLKFVRNFTGPDSYEETDAYKEYLDKISLEERKRSRNNAR